MDLVDGESGCVALKDSWWFGLWILDVVGSMSCAENVSGVAMSLWGMPWYRPLMRKKGSLV